MDNKSENKVQTVSEKLEESMGINEWYDTIGRALIASIPHFGDAICELTYGHGDRIKQKRIEKLVETLKKKIELLEDIKLDDDFMKSDEFYDLVVATFQEATKAGKDEKIKALANILINRSIEAGIEDDDLVIFGNLVSDMSVYQMKLLKHISASFEFPADGTGLSSFQKIDLVDLIDVDKVEYSRLLYHTNDLKQKGLIDIINPNNSSSTSSTTSFGENIYESKEYCQVTELGKRLIKHVLDFNIENE